MLQTKHVEIEVVSILAQMINLAVHLPYAPLVTTKQHVNVLLGLKETLTDNVTKVSSFSISSPNLSFILKTLDTKNNI